MRIFCSSVDKSNKIVALQGYSYAGNLEEHHKI